MRSSTYGALAQPDAGPASARASVTVTTRPASTPVLFGVEWQYTAPRPSPMRTLSMPVNHWSKTKKSNGYP